MILKMTFILFLSWLCAFGEPGKATLTVTIDGIHPGKGDVLVALHNKADSFNPDPHQALALRKADLGPNGTTATAIFPNLPEGEYAISVLKDENGNKRMDFSMIGAPKEGYGISNPPKSKFKKPQFSESKFRVSSGANRITIHMMYF